MAMPENNIAEPAIDIRSGFCHATSIFHSKRDPLPLPPNPFLDVTTFIASQPHHGDVAFIDAATGRRLTFSELWRAVDAVSSYLSRDAGIRKNDVVLILSPNSIFFPVVCLAVLSLGAIVTTANPINTAREIQNQISDSKPKLAFTTRQQAPKLAGSKLSNIVLMDVPGFEEMMRTPSCGERVKERIHQDDPATLLYSSGTTGVCKGVISTHRNLIALVKMTLHRFDDPALRDPKLVCTVPMFHVYGLTVMAMGAVALGSTVVILPRFNMETMLSAIENYKVNLVPVVPPIVAALVREADRIQARYDLSSWMSVLCGGAPVSKELIREFVERYEGVTFLQGHAMTESTGTGTSINTVEESKRYGTVGLLWPKMEAKIVDPTTGKALGVNRTGELWLRGPTIMKGYYKNEEATGAAIVGEGWLRTGDLCYFDQDGFLFVVDRLKELIKYKAYQVAPAELEALLLSHPEISDAAVIPYPDKEVGQYPMAYVVRKAGTKLSEEAIVKFVEKHVAPYKKVRRVAFITSIPKNPSGKILRRQLIKLATTMSTSTSNL